MKRIFRFVVSFLLICVILVNCSPIRARAVEPVTMMIGAGIVIASAVIGLGVMMGSDPVVFDELVSKVASHEKMSDIISVDFKLPVIRYNAITGGIDPNGMSWALSVLVLETIREILFEEDVVLVESIPEGSASYNGTILKEFTAHNYSTYPAEIIIRSRDSSSLSYYCSSGYSVTGDNIVINSHLVVNSYVVYSNVYSNWQYSSYGSKKTFSLDEYDLIWSNLDVLDSSGNVFFSGSEPVFGSRLGVSDGLTAGEIAPQTQTVLDGYPSWSSGSLIDENQNYWYPIGIGQTYDETKTYTQEQVQSGESTYQEEDTGTDEDPDAEQITATGLRGWLADIKDRMTLLLQPISMKVSNIFDAVVAMPNTIVTSIKDFFTPSGNVEAYALDLKLLFPFCIPFDLFNLLKALQADPVAPHFDFELDFGSLGRFPVSVDFSEWNELASLLRTLETALFIVGLAVGTRKLIGG